jgi:hypothetical protein
MGGINMKTYFCIICGISGIGLNHLRCPTCGGDKQHFIMIRNAAENEDDFLSKHFKKSLWQRLFS